MDSTSGARSRVSSDGNRRVIPENPPRPRSNLTVVARLPPSVVDIGPTGESSRSSATHLMHLRFRHSGDGLLEADVQPRGMRSSGSPEDRARRRECERQRRQRIDRAAHRADEAPSERTHHEAGGHDPRAAAIACGWCGRLITPRSRGPIPKWCSATCRHRAWEQTRAAASGRAAVAVIERRVHVRVPLEPTRRDWPRLLSELADQLDDGRIYDRDLPGLARALEPVLQAYRVRARMTGAPTVQ